MQRLYSRLLSLYPRAFRERLGGSMQQTFDDLYHERQSGRGMPAFVLWMFLETAAGVPREHLVLLTEGDMMKIVLKTLGASALIGLFLIAPFMAMELVNRRGYHEEFPFALFFALWFNLFAFSLILLPIVRGRRRGDPGMADPVSTQGASLLTSPRSTLLISIALLLCPITIMILQSLGWEESLNRFFNGPNPGQVHVPGLVMTILVFSLPVAAGIILGRPIATTLRAGGSLFAHPLHLVLVVLILFTYAASVTSLLIDQWPCFMGVHLCD